MGAGVAGRGPCLGLVSVLWPMCHTAWLPVPVAPRGPGKVVEFGTLAETCSLLATTSDGTEFFLSPRLGVLGPARERDDRLRCWTPLPARRQTVAGPVGQEPPSPRPRGPPHGDQQKGTRSGLALWQALHAPNETVPAGSQGVSAFCPWGDSVRFCEEAAPARVHAEAGGSPRRDP